LEILPFVTCSWSWTGPHRVWATAPVTVRVPEDFDVELEEPDPGEPVAAEPASGEVDELLDQTDVAGLLAWGPEVDVL
jgi:hypothetical protein